MRNHEASLPASARTALPRELALESLRGIAALTVVLYHFKTDSLLSTNSFVKSGYLMVDLFFVMSGYVISLNYLERVRDSRELLKFQTKRFWRLYPLHFAMLLAYVGIEFARYVFTSRTGIRANHVAFTSNDLTAFIHNLFLTHSLFLDKLTFNFPSWSISVEFYTYLLFGVLVLTARKRVVPIAILLVSACGLFLVSREPYLKAEVGTSWIRCIYSFFLGVLVFKMRSSAKARSEDSQTGRQSLSALTLLLLCVAGVMWAGGTAFEVALPLLFAGLVFTVLGVGPSSLISRTLAQPLLVYLGTISYSIYLTHALIWWVVTQSSRFIFAVATRADPRGLLVPDYGPIGATLVPLVGVLATVATSIATYHLIEDRFRRGIQRRGTASEVSAASPLP